MGRQRKPVDLFDLGFPIHSRSGLKQVARKLDAHAKTLGEMMGRSTYYGNTELDALAEPLIEMWSRRMLPAQGELQRLAGHLNVLHQAAVGHGEVGLMLARQTADKLMGGAPGKAPPTPDGLYTLWHKPDGSRCVTAHGQNMLDPWTVELLNMDYAFWQLYYPGVNLCTHTVRPVNGQGGGGGGPAPIGGSYGQGWQIGPDGSQCWSLPVPLYYPLPQYAQCKLIDGNMSWLGKVLPAGGTVYYSCGPGEIEVPLVGCGGPGPTNGGPGPIGSPIPQTCPQCGCTIDWGNVPGSSCDRPLFIVQCVPRPKEKVCPAPTESPNSSHGPPTNGTGHQTARRPPPRRTG